MKLIPKFEATTRKVPVRISVDLTFRNFHACGPRPGGVRDFDALRGRDDFKKLLTEVEAKSGPKAKEKD